MAHAARRFLLRHGTDDALRAAEQRKTDGLCQRRRRLTSRSSPGPAGGELRGLLPADLCLQRPVLATMINLWLVVPGWCLFPQIGVDQFPNLELPIVHRHHRRFGPTGDRLVTSAGYPAGSRPACCRHPAGRTVFLCKLRQTCRQDADSTLAAGGVGRRGRPEKGFLRRPLAQDVRPTT